MEKFKFKSVPKKEKVKEERDNFSIEESQKYYTEFMRKISLIKKELNAVLMLDTVCEIDKIRASDVSLNLSIKELKDDYLNNVAFLIGYDKQNYSNLIDELAESTAKIKEIITPKKKFAFSTLNKTVKKQLENESKVEPTTIDAKSIEENMNDFTVKSISDQELTITPDLLLNKNTLIIENITNCKIYALNIFKACYIKNVSNSSIHIGVISGGSHITGLKDTIVSLSTHQLRIHRTFNTTFNIVSSSNPIIENCQGLIFKQFLTDYDGYRSQLAEAKIDSDKNKWNQVLDFNWHKKEKSPNFDIN